MSLLFFLDDFFYAVARVVSVAGGVGRCANVAPVKVANDIYLTNSEWKIFRHTPGRLGKKTDTIILAKYIINFLLSLFVGGFRHILLLHG